MSSQRLSGMVGFSVMWFGQVVSVLGTGMTQFALTIWAWRIATARALVGFCGFFPLAVLSPLAGSGPGVVGSYVRPLWNPRNDPVSDRLSLSPRSGDRDAPARRCGGGSPHAGSRCTREVGRRTPHVIRSCHLLTARL
ncbi:MAG: hypothetical protein NTX23_05640 [Candidatus Bipolaricaulota bacterium]|nr:hypothetical protein [Candidatus Bipolaricaulota bacterium]